MLEQLSAPTRSNDYDPCNDGRCYLRYNPTKGTYSFWWRHESVTEIFNDADDWHAIDVGIDARALYAYLTSDRGREWLRTSLGCDLEWDSHAWQGLLLSEQFWRGGYAETL